MYFLDYCGAIAVLILATVLAITGHKSHPPFIEKVENGKNPECYAVTVWTVTKPGWNGYHQYEFVKRKNGKYRLKFYPIFEWFGGIGYLSLYIGVIADAWDSILKYPETLLLPHLILFLAFMDVWFLLNNASIVARIYFYKYMKNPKNHKKGKKGKRR